MTDVLVVCVREDVELAEKLADMFDGLGFAISCDTDERTLRQCGAGIVVWSRAARASQAFRLTAQRLTDDRKAIAVLADDAPAPISLMSGRTFDLRVWNGEANDPAVDLLFFTVDRLVAAATQTITPIRVATPVLRHTRRVAFGPTAPPAPILEAVVCDEPSIDEDIFIEEEHTPPARANVDSLAAAAAQRMRKINPAGAVVAVMLAALVGTAGWNSAIAGREAKPVQRDNTVTLTAALVDPSTLDMTKPPPPVVIDSPPHGREPASAPRFAVHSVQRTSYSPDSDAAAPNWTSWSGAAPLTPISYTPAG